MASSRATAVGASRLVRAAGAALALAAVFAGAPPDARAGEGADLVPLDRFFRGKVVGLEGDRVRLRYDFGSAEQAKDWPEGIPMPLVRDAGDGANVADGRLLVRGSAGARHVAEWQGDVVVTARWVPDGTKDIGAFLMSADVGTDYMTYTLVETFFHGWDGKAGGDTGMIKFGAQWATAKEFNGFRYMSLRRLSPGPSAGTPLAVTFGRKGTKAVMTVGDVALESNEPGKRMPIVVPGFYAVKSGFAVDDVVVEGTLAKRFVAAKHLSLRTEAPIVADAGSADDPAVAALLEAYAAGKEGPTAVVKVVGDTTRTPTDRAAAAGALKRGPRRALPAVVDLLYHADVAVRASGIDIVKALAGKDFGFDPKGSEKSRAAAIQRLQTAVRDHPELLEGTAG